MTKKKFLVIFLRSFVVFVFSTFFSGIFILMICIKKKSVHGDIVVTYHKFC